MELLSPTRIDLNLVENTDTIPEFRLHPSVASTTLEMGGLAIKFAQVKRAPRYDNVHRENDAEHSFMLALTANELASEHYANMNAAKVTQLAIFHDIVEIEKGDVHTFQFTPEQMAEKHTAEQAVLEKLLRTLPRHTAKLVMEYEEQQTVEARFVKAVDKLLPVATDIIGPGRLVMKEEYGVTTLEELIASHDKLHSRIADSFEEFPLIVEAHKALCRLFQEEFELSATRLSQ